MDFPVDKISFVKDRKGHDKRYSLVWTKIRTNLGFEPQIKFESGIQETISWYKSRFEQD